MTTLICHNCGHEVDVDVLPKEFVCSTCGAVNVVEIRDPTSGEAAGCIPPTSFEWKLPAGVMRDAMGKAIYVTAQGSHMTREEYMAAFGLDPDVALENMRKHRGVRGI